MDTKILNQMVFLLGAMAFWCNGDNYAAAPLLIDITIDLHLQISEAAISVTVVGWYRKRSLVLASQKVH